MPIKLSQTTGLSKQIQLQKETIVQNGESSMTLEKYNSIYKPPDNRQSQPNKSGAGEISILLVCIVCVISVGVLM